jgi:hypothetical protein
MEDRLMAGWFRRSGAHEDLARQLLENAVARVTELERTVQKSLEETATAKGESIVLREAVLLERVRSDRLIDQLLDLRREGFNPPVRAPEPPRPRPRKVVQDDATMTEGEEPAEDPTRAWDRIMGAIQDRAGDNPQLRARMEIDCRRWMQAGLETKAIVERVYHGWSGD